MTLNRQVKYLKSRGWGGGRAPTVGFPIEKQPMSRELSMIFFGYQLKKRRKILLITRHLAIYVYVRTAPLNDLFLVKKVTKSTKHSKIGWFWTEMELYSDLRKNSHTVRYQRHLFTFFQLVKKPGIYLQNSNFHRMLTHHCDFTIEIPVRSDPRVPSGKSGRYQPGSVQINLFGP